MSLFAHAFPCILRRGIAIENHKLTADLSIKGREREVALWIHPFPRLSLSIRCIFGWIIFDYRKVRLCQASPQFVAHCATTHQSN